MPVAHGKAAKLYVNGFDISSYFTKVASAAKADVAEVSTLGTTDKQYLAGMGDGTITADGFENDNPNAAASVMGSAFANPSTIFSHLPQGDGFGKKAIGMVAAMSDWSLDTNTGAAGALSVAASSQDGFNSGIVLHPLQQEAAPGASAVLDSGAASQFGADCYLHVTGAGVGSFQGRLQHSVDNITFVDLCVLPASTTPHYSVYLSSLVAVPSGLVNRYLKFTWTLASGLVTFFASVTRMTSFH